MLCWFRGVFAAVAGGVREPRIWVWRDPTYVWHKVVMAGRPTNCYPCSQPGGVQGPFPTEAAAEELVDRLNAETVVFYRGAP